MKEQLPFIKTHFIIAALCGLSAVQMPGASAAADANATTSSSDAPAGAQTDQFVKAAWKQLSERPQPTEKLMNDLAAAIQKSPQNYQAHYLLGICYQRMGLPDQAISELKLAVQYGPNDAKPMINLIRQAVDAGQLDLAGQVADIAIARFPNNPEIAFWQGNFMMLKNHKLGEAERLFEEVQKSHVVIPNLSLSLATLRFAQKRLDESLALAKQQKLLTPDAPGANLLLGQIYFAKRNYNRAYQFLKPAYNSLVFSPNLARSYMQAAYWTGHYEDCIEPAIVQMALSSTKSIDDENSKQIFRLAASRVPRSRVEEIVKNASATLDTFAHHLPDPAAFHRTLAESLSSIGLHELSASEYKKCLKGDSSDGIADFLLAKELELYCGRYDEALEYYALARQHGVPVSNIDLYIEHLKARINSRGGDMAWQLKDYLHGH